MVTYLLQLALTVILFIVLLNILQTVVPQYDELIEIIAMLLICCTVLPSMLDSFTTLKNITASLGALYSTLLPATTALVVFLSSMFSAVAWQPLTVFLMNGIILIVQVYCVPVLFIATIFDLCTRIYPAISFSKLANFLRLALVSTMSALVMVISSVLTFSGAAFYTIHKAVASPFKKLIEQNIPIIGSILSESLTILKQLQTAAGTFSMLAVVVGISSVAVYPTLKLLLHALTLKALAAIAQPFTKPFIHELLEDFSKTCFVLAAIALLLAFTVIYGCIILIWVVSLGVGKV